MARREKVNFLATRYKNREVNVSFFNKEGKIVSFDSVQKVPRKEKIEFFARVDGKKRRG